MENNRLNDTIGFHVGGGFRTLRKGHQSRHIVDVDGGGDPVATIGATRVNFVIISHQNRLDYVEFTTPDIPLTPVNP